LLRSNVGVDLRNGRNNDLDGFPGCYCSFIGSIDEGLVDGRISTCNRAIGRRLEIAGDVVETYTMVSASLSGTNGKKKRQRTSGFLALVRKSNTIRLT
jgi:hypothetical protein